MTGYDNNNRGSIWPNKKKEKDTHPDFTGSLNVDGKDYWVSAWKRKPDAGERAPSLTFTVKPKDGKPMNATRGRIPGSPETSIDLSDEVPF